MRSKLVTIIILAAACMLAACGAKDQVDEVETVPSNASETLPEESIELLPERLFVRVETNLY